MTQLLSLAFGNRPPPGLSGGATPSSPSKLSFADLLTAPLPAEAILPPGQAGTIAPAIPVGGEASLDLPDLPLGAQGADFLGNAEASLHPLGPQGDLAASAQTEDPNAPGQAVDPTLGENAGTSDESLVAAAAHSSSGDQPAVPMPTAAHGDAQHASAQPEPAALAAQAEADPANETAAPGPDGPSDASVEQDLADRQDDGPQVARSDAESGAPLNPAVTSAIRQASQTTNGSADPSRALSGVQPGSAADRAEALSLARGDDQPQQPAKLAAETADTGASRVAGGPSTGTTGTGDFAQLVRADSAQAPTALAGAGPGAADVMPPARMDMGRHAAGESIATHSVPDTVSARPGEIGRQLGVEIVRHGLDGRDSLTVRLDPVEMGEIQIRIQFDDRGTMRAVVTAESAAALDMLKRDSADLFRALGDAGVRTDGQSFQFDGRGHGRDRSEQQAQHGQAGKSSDHTDDLAQTDDESQSPQRKLRTSGSIDLFA